MEKTPAKDVAASDGARGRGETYDRRTIRLHWTTAALLAALWVIAQVIDDFPKGFPRVCARSAHIVLGLLLAVVVVRRIAWRVRHGSRLAVPGPGWMSSATAGAHHLLYAGLVAVLLLGMANAWARGDNLFGLFAIPKLMPGYPQLKPTIESLHRILANSLMIVAMLHALAALWHHLWLKDDVLRRMLGR